jgi:hypothetical protein
MDRQCEKQFWGVSELAEKAGVTGSYIRYLLGDGTIQGFKRGSERGGFWEIPENEAKRWLAERGVVEEK